MPILSENHALYEPARAIGWERPAMECKTCDSLLADYKYSVKLFTDAVQRLPGLVGHDRELAHQKLEQLRVACRNADNALTAHRAQHKTGLIGKGASS